MLLNPAPIQVAAVGAPSVVLVSYTVVPSRRPMSRMTSPVFHAAFFTTPRRDASYSHELESIGTLHLAAAAAAAGVGHLVLRSFTAVYGARGQNPNFLDEERRPDGHARLAWVRDKVEAEEHAFSFSRRYPGLGVSVLRFATLLGPGVHTFYTRIFSKRVVPVLLGYDPLLQLLHPDDALAAVDAVLAKGPSGVVNVVPRDTMSLLTALHLSDKLTVAVPHLVAYPLADLWWGTGVGEAPGGFIDYARFLFVGDGEKAIQYLAGEGKYADRAAYPFPALFLLDLKMPVKDGLEVLRWLHEHPDIPGKLPVVVFSSTELPGETQRAYAMDIQACIVKPLNYPELREKIRILKEYWLDYEAEPAS